MLYTMNFFAKTITVALCLTWMNTVQAEEMDSITDLMQTLKTKTPEIKEVEPVKQQEIIKNYKKEYVLDWLVKPKIEVSDADMKTYKNPVKIKMTVLGSAGLVIKSDILKSSGSKSFDAKVVQALASAKIQPIQYADQTVIYELVHEFSVAN